MKIIEIKHIAFNLFMVIPLHLSSLPQEPIRPLEKRALNFLVNEYLLKNEYKLSSITFSDENDDQVNLRLCSFFSLNASAEFSVSNIYLLLPS